MKAIGYTHAQFGLPIDNPNALAEITLPDPAPQGRDILVEVRAVSVNPVDTKVRRGSTPAAGEVKVLGWDAVGVVRATGSDVSLFKPGDRVCTPDRLPGRAAIASCTLSMNALSATPPSRWATPKQQPCRSPG